MSKKSDVPVIQVWHSGRLSSSFSWSRLSSLWRTGTQQISSETWKKVCSSADKQCKNCVKPTGSLTCWLCKACTSCGYVLLAYPNQSDSADNLWVSEAQTHTAWLHTFVIKPLYAPYMLQFWRINAFSPSSLDSVWTPHQMTLQFFMLLLQFPLESTSISQHVIAPEV